MGFNSFYAEVVSPFLRSTTLGERLDMALIAFKANLQFAVFMYAQSGGKIFSEAEIEEIFSGLDADSIAVAKRFMSRQYNSPHRSLMVHPKYFYTQAEHEEYQKVLPEYFRVFRRCHLLQHKVGVESAYYHHGLRLVPDFVKENIKVKLVLNLYEIAVNS